MQAETYPSRRDWAQVESLCTLVFNGSLMWIVLVGGKKALHIFSLTALLRLSTCSVACEVQFKSSEVVPWQFQLPRPEMVKHH